MPRISVTGVGGNFWLEFLGRTEGFVVGCVFDFLLFFGVLICGKGGEGKRIGS